MTIKLRDRSSYVRHRFAEGDRFVVSVERSIHYGQTGTVGRINPYGSDYVVVYMDDPKLASVKYMMLDCMAELAPTEQVAA